MPIPTDFLGERDTCAGADTRLREVLKKSLQDSHHSRAEVAERMSAELGAIISEAWLNDRLAPSKPSRTFPAAYVRAFCIAVESEELALSLLSEAGRDCYRVGKEILKAVERSGAAVIRQRKGHSKRAK